MPGRMRRRFVIAALIAAAALPAVAARRRAVRAITPYPQCEMVTGTSAVTFTRDEGAHVIPFAAPPHGISYTYGVASLIGADDALAAWNGNELLISNDAGCSWRVAATIPGAEFPPALEPAPGGRVYAWADNRNFLVRYDNRGAIALKPPGDFVGFGADRANGEHLRAGGTDGTIWESRDGGTSWEPAGRLEGAPLIYRFAFDARDFDHIVAGTLSNGAYVSRDAGKTWTRATLGERGANVFQLVISPVDSNRVWAMAIDNSAPNDDPAHGRHIYISDDGGATYAPVVDESPGVKLINGPTMAAHPSNRDVLYFVFGTYYAGYGTDLFRYDHATRTLTMTHNDHDGIDAIAFSRRDPSVMYLGIEEIEHTGAQ